ncbi:hypothetical protein SS1G_12049 [Sclerotinia sclerotiorum 1980 UF-70]|uniref:Rieske domain-containing protein n=2 Tax=Sclerotinia sclerotiorum (strain ATCC 18683 / 1980 / Ss-1) TaxID=665079 RepID=A7F2A2_SCLS1|nr:hypothetical protein SS1G_12049 [Sclerotinia sclerotiorum 1980 UF-70]APA09273.1 hypothetical protein sscle_05g040430 [Sclerotinia sclerotiorum 1980 UF-70]EDN95844.1 hypothetical protein SS1G_12049 [Sclerotinia sclerotiorum 1980 UF-70]
MPFFNAFVGTSRAGDAWFLAGLTASFPNITASGDTVLSNRLPCKGSFAPGCKVFNVPLTDSTQAVEVDLDDAVAAGLKDQVIVFQYQGKFHAVDHSCPHSSFPLSRGTPFDIEDFGIRLSVGIQCPKHDWSFDLIHGKSDRGSYKLKVWEVQLRPIPGAENEESEVWVRRKQRIG